MNTKEPYVENHEKNLQYGVDCTYNGVYHHDNDHHDSEQHTHDKVCERNINTQLVERNLVLVLSKIGALYAVIIGNWYPNPVLNSRNVALYRIYIIPI